MNSFTAVLVAAALGTLPGWIAYRKGRCFIDWWLYGTALFIIALPHVLLVRTTPVRCIYKGVFLLATAQVQGLAYFRGAPERFAASLVSLAVWPVIGVSAVLAGGGREVLVDSLASICALLAPPVLSFEIAARWGRSALWMHYATAFNWCQWALPVVGIALVLLTGALGQVGLPDHVATVLLVAGVAGYGLWLHWFLARQGLDLSPMRAAVLVAAVNLGTLLLVLVPRLLLTERT